MCPHRLTDQELVGHLDEAERTGDTEALILAENDICARLNIPLDETEQGLCAEAERRIEEFCRANPVV